MLNKNLIMVCVMLFLGLVGVAAIAFERNENAKQINAQLTQTQLILLNAERRLLQIEQQQHAFASALSQIQAQHANERNALNHALAENTDWGNEKLPENIKKAIKK